MDSEQCNRKVPEVLLAVQAELRQTEPGCFSGAVLVLDSVTAGAIE